MLEKTKEVLKDHASEYGVSEKVWKEIKDVENGVKLLLELKAEYEASKHYIELGKAVEKFFNYIPSCEHQYNVMSLGELYEEADKYFFNVEELLEWAEGR
jgi:hypothetical protein